MPGKRLENPLMFDNAFMSGLSSVAALLLQSWYVQILNFIRLQSVRSSQSSAGQRAAWRVLPIQGCR